MEKLKAFFIFKKMRARQSGGVVLVMAALCAGGCSTPTKQIKDFGAACGSIGADAQKAYVLLDDSVRKKQIYRAALHPEAPVTGEIFDGIMADNDRLATRTKLLSALSDYAAALQQLADRNFRTDIDKSSKDLGVALGDMKTTYEKSTQSDLNISQSDIKILSTMVDAAGSAYVEHKRKQAIKAIVDKADPAVQQVSKLLQAEFEQIGPAVETQLGNVETDFEKAYNLQAEKMTFQERIGMLEKIQSAHDNVKNAAGLYTSLAAAAEKIGKTHASLKKSLDQDEWTTEELVNEVRDLADWAKTVKNFYSSLE